MNIALYTHDSAFSVRIRWLLNQTDFQTASVTPVSPAEAPLRAADLHFLHLEDLSQFQSMEKLEGVANEVPVVVFSAMSEAELKQYCEHFGDLEIFESEDLSPPLLERILNQSIRLKRMLREKEIERKRYQRFFQLSSDCMFEVAATDSGEYRYLDLNPEALRCVGVPLEQALGHTPTELMGAQAGGTVETNLTRARDQRMPYHFEGTLPIEPDPQTYTADYVPSINEAGKVETILGRAKNITDIMVARTALLQTAKLETLGGVAAGVAHDLNNALAILDGVMNLLPRQKTANDVVNLLSEGKKAVQQGATIVSRLLAFARNEKVDARPHDINSILEEIRPFMRMTLGPTIKKEVLLHDGLWQGCCNKGEFEVCILNLVGNARDAMPNGGILTIQTTNLRAEVAPTNVLPAGDYVVVSISDNGTGMTPEILSRVGKPFFTTKAGSKGTGLGLSLARKNLHDVGGDLTIESSLGRGTTVKLFLACPRV